MGSAPILISSAQQGETPPSLLDESFHSDLGGGNVPLYTERFFGQHFTIGGRSTKLMVEAYNIEQLRCILENRKKRQLQGEIQAH